MGIEPISSEPESDILSIELKVHPNLMPQRYNNIQDKTNFRNEK